MNWLEFTGNKKKVALAVAAFLITNSAFGLFILEEGQQQTGFSVFIAQDTENWQAIEDISIPAMETTIRIGQIYWYIMGWANPIMVVPYYVYFFHSAPAYLKMARTIMRSKNQGVD